MTITERLKQTNLFVILGTVAASVVLALALSAPAQADEHKPLCFDELDDTTGRISSCWDSKTMGNRRAGFWHEGSQSYQLVKYGNNGIRTI